MTAAPKPAQDQSEIFVPAHLRHFVDVLGVDGAVEFLLTFGGAYAYFSLSPEPQSNIAAEIGVEATAAIAKRFGPGSMRVPTGKPFIAAVFRAKGMKPSEIARRLHVTDVTVRSWFADADDRQLRLL
ncbi:MAG: hypothetical protein KF810_02790 [Rhizobiaceae bacterium]|nr:hypothetical protein [Rhizobiaceae bacterium]